MRDEQTKGDKRNHSGVAHQFECVGEGAVAKVVAEPGNLDTQHILIVNAQLGLSLP